MIRSMNRVIEIVDVYERGAERYDRKGKRYNPLGNIRKS